MQNNKNNSRSNPKTKDKRQGRKITSDKPATADLISRIENILLDWKFGLNVNKSTDSAIINYIAHDYHIDNNDRSLTRFKLVINQLAASDLIKLRTISSLRNKLKDEKNVIQSDKDIITSFKEIQDSIPYIENGATEKLAVEFNKFIPDHNESGLNNLDVPYIV